MKTYFKFISILFLFIIPFTVYATVEEGTQQKEKRRVPKPGIKSMKPPEPNIPDEYKDLEKVYNQYWKYIIEKNYKKAYEMESSTFRKSNPYKEDLYKDLILTNVALTAVMALEVEKINEKEVVVKGHYYYNIGALKSVKPFSDKWVKEKDNWMHVPTSEQFK